MAIEKEPFGGARFKVEHPMTTLVSTSYCTTERERDALVQSIKQIRGKRAKVIVTDLAEGVA